MMEILAPQTQAEYSSETFYFHSRISEEEILCRIKTGSEINIEIIGVPPHIEINIPISLVIPDLRRLTKINLADVM